MIVNNLKNKVIIEVGDVPSNFYTITPIDINGCPSESNKISGEFSTNKIEIELPDGKYLLSVYSANTADYVEEFIVYYNSLPSLIKSIKEVICPCTNCKEKTKDDYIKIMIELLGFLQSTNLLCSTGGFSLILQKYYKILQDKREYEKYYGSFVFDTEKAIRDILVHTYIELYSEFTSNSLGSDKVLAEVNSLFLIDSMENCLYKLGYDFQEILCNINNYKCKCNE